MSCGFSSQLAVQCHEKKAAPRGMARGSATTDDQFAYFTPYDSNSVYMYGYECDYRLRVAPYHNSGLVIIDGELTAVGGENECHCTNKLFTTGQMG